MKQLFQLAKNCLDRAEVLSIPNIQENNEILKAQKKNQLLFQNYQARLLTMEPNKREEYVEFFVKFSKDVLTQKKKKRNIEFIEQCKRILIWQKQKMRFKILPSLFCSKKKKKKIIITIFFKLLK